MASPGLEWKPSWIDTQEDVKVYVFSHQIPKWPHLLSLQPKFCNTDYVTYTY